jgi:RHS repeat-associated protein
LRDVKSSPGASFSIDAAGRTIGHTPASGPALAFAFDATGLRTKRTEGASTTLYLRDGGQVIGEWNGTSWTKEYVWLGSTLLATIEGSTIQYHHQDHLSIRATTFADGMVGEEQGHYPFGEPWYETSPETTRIFTTYEREAGGSLDYAMFRWMGPEAGRFLSADPVHGSMGDGQSWNRYAYAGNDPVNRWDPWGLAPLRLEPIPWWWWRYAFFESVTVTASTPLLGGGGGGSAGGSGGGDRLPPGFERLKGKLLGSRQFLHDAYCLFKAGGFGWDPLERAGWVVETGSGIAVNPWPFGATLHKAAIPPKNTWPAGRIAIIHTHDNRIRGGQFPSEVDFVVANNKDYGGGQRLPVLTLTNKGIGVFMPGSPSPTNPTMLAGPDWYASVENEPCP